MPSDRPPSEAYGRVTRPERYAVVQDAARRLLDELVDRFDVNVDSPDTRLLAGPSTAHVRPRGDPDGGLTITLTEFPGVRLRLGAWFDGHFPRCGCDACDEDPEMVIEDIGALVGDFVSGRFVEWTDGRRLGFIHSSGNGWSRLSHGHELFGHAPERHEWPAWERRRPEVPER